ncbi:hypothetical protein B0H34DRAFT_153772 [Crassisporium funariophilum]|nr:hypothetical protein B0H34DRAFT_153772 [Crassisporium funariophilum]
MIKRKGNLTFIFSFPSFPLISPHLFSSDSPFPSSSYCRPHSMCFATLRVTNNDLLVSTSHHRKPGLMLNHLPSLFSDAPSPELPQERVILSAPPYTSGPRPPIST